jgi:predicted DCC family thiol-disulfide oxidoreductase YuxK
VAILDKYEKIDFISLTKADQECLLDKVPIHQRFKSFYLIFPKGETKSGSDALPELIAILPGGKIISPIINNFPGGKKAVQFIYKRFSRCASLMCLLEMGFLSSGLIVNALLKVYTYYSHV